MYYNYLIFLFIFLLANLSAQDTSATTLLDQKVRQFLEEKHGTWRDMNVPESDGKYLFDLIIKNNYTKALEIGTSTGHSSIWIAWALSKTGGRLITIEINNRRYEQAVEHFKQAGLEDYIDARLADAHELVPEVEGPFDFVFCDADKDWYTRYFESVWAKIEQGGCFTAHNVLNSGRSGIRQFLKHIEHIKDAETQLIRSSSSGISVTQKVKPR